MRARDAELGGGGLAQVEGVLPPHGVDQVAQVRYAAVEAGTEKVGAMKLAAFERADDTILCMHDEIGYRASFRQVAEQMARTLDIGNATQTGPMDLEITIARVGKQSIGFDVERHLRSGDERDGGPRA